MARLVKEWMKAKKGICSSDCECLTITWWRCYAEEHLCNCGDWGSTPPVPPVPPTPDFTYSLEKTSTRWFTVTYTATKTPYGESEPVGVYEVQVGYEEYQWEAYIARGKVWDCTSDCVWRTIWDQANHIASTYVNQAELALVDWTQEAFESVYNAFIEFYTTDWEFMYYADYSEAEYGNWRAYTKVPDIESSEESEHYWLIFDKDSETWEITGARVTWNETSDSGKAVDMTIANWINNRSSQALSTWTQTDFKAIFTEVKTLYNSLD